MASLDLVMRLKDEASKGLKEVGRNVDKVESKGERLRKVSQKAGLAVAGIAAAGVGIGVNLVKDMLEASVEIDNLANIAAFGAEELQVLANVARASGGSIEDVADASREMQLRLAEAAELGSGPAVDALNLLGVTLDELDALTPAEQFDILRDKLSAIDDPARRTFLAEELLGGSSERLAEFLALSSEEFDKQTQAMLESGKVMTDEQIAKNIEAAAAVQSLKDSVGGVTQELLSNFSPVITRVARFIEGNMTPIVYVLAAAMGVLGLTASINLVARAFRSVSNALGVARAAFLAIRPIIASVNAVMLANPIGLFIAALVALGVALVIAYNQSETFRNGVDAVWRGIVDIVKGSVNTIIGFINRLIDAWNGLTFKIPTIKLPKVNLPFGRSVGGGSFGGQSFSFPKLGKIPKLAEGGIVTSPTLALVGEAGPEAVVPLGRAGRPTKVVNYIMLDQQVLASQVLDITNNFTRQGAIDPAR